MAIVTVPVVTLLAVSTYGAMTTVQGLSDQRSARQVSEDVLVPLGRFIEAVQDERTAASAYLADEAATSRRVTAAGEDTASAAEALDAGVAAARTAAAEFDPEIPETMDAALASGRDIGRLRASVVARNVDWEEAYQRYTDVIESAFRVQTSLSTMPLDESASDPRAAYELAYGREMLTRVDAVMAAMGTDGALTPGQYAEVAGAARTSEALFTSLNNLRPAEADAFRNAVESESYAHLAGVLGEIVAGGTGAVAISGQDWESAAEVVLADLASAQAEMVEPAAEESTVLSPDAFGQFGPVVALGIAGAILSVLVYFIAGRRLFRDLVSLRYAALDLATHKLPDALRRLNDGADVDLDKEAPAAQQSSDEIGQINAALTAVHRAAISMAIERARVVRSLSGVYVSLARRSQVLLHRQLALLDELERRTEKPQDLEDLFRLDHLTIRMRRQAESLIILSGSNPARRWRFPVPVVDVIRGAVAEVEDFARVDVQEMPDMSVVGGSVADLTHMLAELVDNALAFSPPQARPVIRGFRAGSSLAIEIEDQGLGMSRQALADANERIQDAGKIDLLEADQLGLLVVNRLAHRQNVTVALDRSPYGGVTATVLIPEAILETPGFTASRAGSEPPISDASPRRRAGVVRPPQRLASAPEPSLPPAGDVRPAVTGTWTQVSVGQATKGSPETGGVMSSGDGAADDGLGAVDELPRRVRQANLVPELRAEAQPGQAQTTAGSPSAGRTPEQARATLVALRAGWLRGLNETDDHQGKSG